MNSVECLHALNPDTTPHLDPLPEGERKHAASANAANVARPFYLPETSKNL